MPILDAQKRKTSDVLAAKGERWLSAYRYWLPTHLHSLVSNLLEETARQAAGEAFVMPKVFIKGGCQIQFARNRVERKHQIASLRCTAANTVCWYDVKANVWKVEKA